MGTSRTRSRRQTRREDVTELGRRSHSVRRLADSAAEEITVFDSTGLAVQDLAVAALVYERWRAGGDGAAFAGVVEIDLH